MPLYLIKILSYIWDIPIVRTGSPLNPYLEVVWSQGKKMLNTKEANFSFGNGYTVFDKATKEITEEIKRAQDILILGFGCGSILHLLEKNFEYKNALVGVEYDSKIIELFKAHFAEDYSLNPSLIVADAQKYVNACQTNFDIVFIDLFQELNNVEFVFEEGFINQLVKCASSGSLVFNITSRNEQDEKRISALILQLSKHYKNVYTVKFQEFNCILIAK